MMNSRPDEVITREMLGTTQDYEKESNFIGKESGRSRISQRRKESNFTRFRHGLSGGAMLSSYTTGVLRPQENAHPPRTPLRPEA